MGAILDKTAYEMKIAVSSFEVDRYNRLKISSLLKFQQEIGERHLNEFGTNSHKMRDDEGKSFIFTKIKIIVHRLPKAQDEVTLTTWCSELKGIRFYRNYILRDEKGELLTETKAEVTVIDLVTRKLVRPNEIDGFEGFLYNTDLQNGCDKPQKLSVPEGEFIKTSRPIHFSDIDYNGHVNNTVYACIVLDCLDPETLKKDIKGFEINYVSEILPNETLELLVVNKETEKVVVGNTATNQSFIARVEI